MKKAGAAKGSTKAAAKPRKVAGSNYKLAQKFPEGTTLTDLTKTVWKLGQPIGSGGFGLLYLADSNSSGPVSSNAGYVIKVEPHTNGPLFCELHFYQRGAKAETIQAWVSSHRLKFLGVPKFIATGNIDFEGIKYRFLVMQRFGTDLQKLFEAGGKQFPAATVFQLGNKLLDALEYIHAQHYVHADIKASNLLTGHADPYHVYLVDYGLAFRYSNEGKHKEYREDPKRTHDGTIEFTSRDAHLGVTPSRRGDLEILGYCMVQWLCGKLPWEDKLTDKNYVKNEKIRYMSDIPLFMKKCFPNAANIPVKELSSYIQYVSNLQYDEAPDYNRCRGLFNQALSSLNCKDSDRIDFSQTSSILSSPKPGRKRQYANASPCSKPKISKSQSASSVDSEPSPKVARKSPSTAKSPLKSAAKSTACRAPAKSTPVKSAASKSAAKSTPLKSAASKSTAKSTPVKSAAAKSAAKSTPVQSTTASTNGRKAASVNSASKRQSTPKSGVAPRAKGKQVRRKRKVDAVSASTQTTPGLDR